MKESKFNEYFLAPDGTKLAFNSYSCGLAIVDDSYERLLDLVKKNVSQNEIPDELRECYEAACEGMFIVPDDKNEILDLLTKRNVQKYSLDSLGLTIAPTLACNFKCLYCYETSKPGVMGSELTEKIVDFVKAQSDHLKNLSISWYGGEPLLAKKIVYSLSEQFLNICSEKGIQYNAFMISNGSLLDDDTISKLIEYKVTGIQITVDGPPAVHNSRRVSKNGRGTFDLIIDNVNKLIDSGKIDVVLRINVDKSNDADVRELISILAERLHSKLVKITFGQVTAYTETCRSIENKCYDNGEFAVRLLHYYSVLQEYGFDECNKFPYPEAKVNYCCAELANSFVIDPEGYAYKCWNEVGNVKHSVGNIDNGTLDIAGYKNGQWLNRNPLLNGKCAKCSLVPICMGGCPYNDISLQKGNVCDLIKYNIREIMLKYYEMNR